MKKFSLFFIIFVLLSSFAYASLQERVDSNGNSIPYRFESFSDGSVYQIFGDGVINRVDESLFKLFAVTSPDISYLNNKCNNNPNGIIYTKNSKYPTSKCLALTSTDRIICTQNGYTNPVSCGSTSTTPIGSTPTSPSNPSCNFPYGSLNECISCGFKDKCVNGKTQTPSFSSGVCAYTTSSQSCSTTPINDNTKTCSEQGGFLRQASSCTTTAKSIFYKNQVQGILCCVSTTGSGSGSGGTTLSPDQICKNNGFQGSTPLTCDSSHLLTLATDSQGNPVTLCCVGTKNDGGGDTSGGETPTATTSVDFKLFNIFRIDGLTKEQWNELDVPFLARLDSAAPSLDIYRFTIKNTGDKASSLTIETFLVAQSNPFSATVTQGLNAIPLQATYGRAGITEKDLTCKSEDGKRFTITEMQPNEERTYYFSINVPRQGDVFAGNPNYDINGHYYIMLNAISGCTGDVQYYDILGGARGFVPAGQVPAGQVPAGQVPAGQVPTLDANKTPINPSAKQKTTTLEKVRTSTGTELLESTCVTTSQCKDDANCINLQSLINDGIITKTDAESRLTKYRVAIDTAGVAAGAGLATLGGVTSVGAYSSLCAAIGAGTGGLGLPICLGVLAVGGAIIGGLSADYVSDLIQGIDKKDPSSVGYCIEKESKSIFSLSGIKDSIGKAINDLFGGQAKTKASNSTIGLIALIVIGILIVLRLTSKR